MKKIVIRVDSSTKIGSGHLMRCLTLAKQLKKKEQAELYFISRDLEGNLNNLIRSQGFNLIALPHHNVDVSLKGYESWLTVPQSVDAMETEKILKYLQPIDKLVIDSYAIDISWESIMRPYVNEIFVIDDLANRKHDCDVLLDQNFYLDMNSRYNDLVPSTCELRLGPKYALLREEFYEAKKQLRQRDGSIKNILVFYGGIDLTNETMKALQAIVDLNLLKVVINVVVGVGNANKESIEEYCKQHDFHYYCQIDNMAELMNQADLALGAGGSTTWERCFLGLPSIVTSVAKNQEKISQDLFAEDYIIYLGKAQDCNIEKIVKTIKNLNKNLLINIQKKSLNIWQ